MKRIGLLSDTHGFLHPRIFYFFENVDEIWHAGDFGNIEVADRLAEFKPLKGVYGNIDGQDVRVAYPLHQRFRCEDVDVWMTHIGGYPGRYEKYVMPEIFRNPPDLFISGHSHILKVIFDKKLNFLHMNPGAAGVKGFHKVLTALRFVIDGKDMRDLGSMGNGKTKEIARRIMKIKIHHFFDVIRDFGSGKDFNPHPYKHSYHKVAQTIWKNPETEFEVVVAADETCKGCIHLIGTSCNDIITHRKDFSFKESFNNYLDNRIIEVCGIDISKKYTAKSLLQFSKKYIENIEFIYEGNDKQHTANRKENVLKGLKIYSAKSA